MTPEEREKRIKILQKEIDIRIEGLSLEDKIKELDKMIDERKEHIKILETQQE